MGPDTVAMRFLVAALVWFFGLTAIAICRRYRIFTWALILLAAIELGGLFYLGPVRWRSLIRLPEASPVLRHLATLPDVGLVAGRLQNLAVDAGQTTAYPYLGITPPPPNYLLEPTSRSPGENTPQRSAGSIASVYHTVSGRHATTSVSWRSSPVLPTRPSTA